MQLSPRLPWYCLLSAVVLVPLAVGVVPVAGILVTLNAFVQPKLIVLCLTLALSLATWAVTSFAENPLYTGRGLAPLGAFVAVAALATALGVSPRMAFFGDAEQGVGLLVMLLCALACFLTTQLVRDKKRLYTLTSFVILTATAVAVIGLLQQVLGLDLLGIGRGLSLEWIIQRGYGTIGNADTYAAYLVFPALLAVHRVRLAADSSDRMKWVACLTAILTSLVMAQTRAPIVGLAVGAAAYAAAARRASRRPEGKSKKSMPARTATKSTRFTTAIAIASVAAGVIAATFLATASDFAERFGVQSLVSLGGRIPLWASALRIATTRPFLGVGPDSFRLGWYPVREASHLAAGAGLVITDPHSVPLLIAATMGFGGLLVAGYLLVATVLAGFRTSTDARSTRGDESDFDAWLYGTIALSVTLLASLLTSALLFMLFIALGVLIAPTLHKTLLAEKPRGISMSLRVTSVLAAVLLTVFALLSGAAQLAAIRARTEDAELALSRAGRAVSLAPWDTEIRDLKFDATVQAALEQVFTDNADAPRTVAQAEADLSSASGKEPYEYRFPYRLALLLIGSGQKLGAEYTTRGIEAGMDGLKLYPSSVELRTGVASGYMALDEPREAEAVLSAFWDADPAYLQAGLTYVEALAGQGKYSEARATLTTLEARFPNNQALSDLADRIPTE